MASKRRLRRRECTRKKRLEMNKALSTARFMRRQGHLVRAYRCKWCGGWHIGHTPWRIARQLRHGNTVKN